MIVHYSLDLEDHLAWYDYYCSIPHGRHERSKLPLIGNYMNRMKRENFGRALTSRGNDSAFGQRYLELHTDGVREFSKGFDFSTAWPDIAIVAATSTHLFIAHVSMSSHIVPLRAFPTDTERIAYIRCAEARGSTLKKKAQQANPANRHPFGTSGMSPADSASRAGDTPEASGDS